MTKFRRGVDVGALAGSGDNVNHPSHYAYGSIECIEAIEAALGDTFPAYCRGNVLKYVWRATHKLDAAEDMRKAAWYAQRCANWLDKDRG